MSYEYIQKPCLNVKRALELWGTWSRLFARSLETRQEQDIIVSEGDPRFWDMWTIARINEQFEEEVERQAKRFRELYPKIRMDKKTLRQELRQEMKADWKPNISLIRREIRAYRRERKEEVSWLKESIRK